MRCILAACVASLSAAAWPFGVPWAHPAQAGTQAEAPVWAFRILGFDGVERGWAQAASPPGDGGGTLQMLPETVVRLQSSTPGTEQQGHSNISGTTRTGELIAQMARALAITNTSGTPDATLHIKTDNVPAARFSNVGETAILDVNGLIAAVDVSDKDPARFAVHANGRSKFTHTNATIPTIEVENQAEDGPAANFSGDVTIDHPSRTQALARFRPLERLVNINGQVFFVQDTAGQEAATVQHTHPAGRALLAYNQNGGEGLRGSSIDGVGVVGDSSDRRFDPEGGTSIAGLFISEIGRPLIVDAFGSNTASNAGWFINRGVGRAALFQQLNPNLAEGDLATVEIKSTTLNQLLVLRYDGAAPSNRALLSVNNFGSGDRPVALFNKASVGAALCTRTIGNARVEGNFHVTGTLSKGGGTFKIDHPLDPQNKYLAHSFVESPDMMNIYNGNVTTDAKGFAEVQLPEWFEALNSDFRYQLTVIGQFAQAIVATKVSGGRFGIRTDKPHVEVSWQVTGIRKDAWAEKNRVVVEDWKSLEDRGKYLHPEAFGLGPEYGMFYESLLEATWEGGSKPSPLPDARYYRPAVKER